MHKKCRILPSYQLLTGNIQDNRKVINQSEYNTKIGYEFAITQIYNWHHKIKKLSLI